MQTTHRVIYELTFLLWSNQEETIPIDREGNALPWRRGDPTHGRPHPPKRRTIDLRTGDHIMLGGAWHRIRGILCTRDQWLTEEEAASLAGDEGYLYRPTRTPAGKPRA
jgi:hypothetical protein